jgi:hypothetical protein
MNNPDYKEVKPCIHNKKEKRKRTGMLVHIPPYKYQMHRQVHPVKTYTTNAAVWDPTIIQ